MVPAPEPWACEIVEIPCAEEPIFVTSVSEAPSSRRLEEIDRADALDLLGTVTYGRVVFTSGALPAIRPVNHVLDDDEIVIRTRRLSSIGAAAIAATGIASGADPGLVVAYQADDLDPENRLGWSVVVTGLAERLTHGPRLARIEAILHPWVDAPMDTAFVIHPEIVTGYRFVVD